jgi:hypothetical protein
MESFVEWEGQFSCDRALPCYRNHALGRFVSFVVQPVAHFVANVAVVAVSSHCFASKCRRHALASFVSFVLQNVAYPLRRSAVAVKRSAKRWGSSAPLRLRVQFLRVRCGP